MATIRIDSHQHFWSYSAREYPWIKAGSPLERDWLPGDLEALQSPLGLDGSVAVQARQGLEESRWLLELAERNPRILGVVGWVDLRSEDVARQLAEFSSNRRFVGVRHVVQDEPDDRFLLGPDFVRGIGHLQPLGLRYDLLLFPRQLPSALELVERFPDLPFVLDHCAKPGIAKGEMEPWARDLAGLASHPNVYCKVSGLVTEADWNDWSLESLQPYLAVVESAFGRGRLMWGSDWPVCLLASAYERWWEAARRWVSGWSPAEQAGFFGGNAARFYGLDGAERP
jgi:L-fuconolactonase